MRNHIGLKTRAAGNILDRVHGQAHAVDRDRAFLSDEFAKLCRHFDFEQPALGEIFPLRDEPCRIDVTGHKMAAQLVRERQRLFEIHQRANA